MLLRTTPKLLVQFMARFRALFGERQPNKGWPRTAALVAVLTLLGSGIPSAKPQNCVYIFQDEVGLTAKGFVNRNVGPAHAIPLANLMGHWPHYEVRVRPIWSYRSRQVEDCRATFYVGTFDDTDIPYAFLEDFFRTKRQIAWIGFGARKLDQSLMQKVFHHHVSEIVSVDKGDARIAGFYDRVIYKGGDFQSELDEEDDPVKNVSTTLYQPSHKNANTHVLAWQRHSKSSHQAPYVLRADNKFLIADIPFAFHNMRRNDRYLAFADLLFDILLENPLRKRPIAIGRLEDIHGFYDLPLLKNAMAAFRKENIPINIAHIPLFADPQNKEGRGAIRIPLPATESTAMLSLLAKLAKDPRNTILWHGVTHQLSDTPNPNTGTSGHDFEFWDKVKNRPVADDSPEWILARLATGLAVLEAYGRQPRYWITPHYEASALANVVFGKVFPWVIGGVTYYASSFEGSFTLGAVSRSVASTMPSVTQEVLDRVRATSFSGVDRQSKGRISQDFPFEIYRDVYGQRVLPETLGYISVGASDQPTQPNDVDRILAEAQRNRAIRDMWGSFFFHPYLLAAKQNGGISWLHGDAAELRRLLAGLKRLGYRFISLHAFERSLGPGLTSR